MNKWMGIGRLTADPKIATAQSGTLIASYTLAVNRPRTANGQDAADFIRCKAFGKGAEFAQNYLHKGTKIAVEGRIQTGSYERDGVKRYTTDIVVDRSEFVESKQAQESSATPAATAPEPADYTVVEPDELPF